MTGAENFAARLKELREQIGLTQLQLAERAGMKLGGIRDLEQGRRSPQWETVLALAEALSVDCTAFASPPISRKKVGPGRPAKVKRTSERVKSNKSTGTPGKSEKNQDGSNTKSGKGGS